jgi:hypothetical protein
VDALAARLAAAGAEAGAVPTLQLLVAACVPYVVRTALLPVIVLSRLLLIPSTASWDDASALLWGAGGSFLATLQAVTGAVRTWAYHNVPVAASPLSVVPQASSASPVSLTHALLRLTETGAATDALHRLHVPLPLDALASLLLAHLPLGAAVAILVGIVSEAESLALAFVLSRPVAAADLFSGAGWGGNVKALTLKKPAAPSPAAAASAGLEPLLLPLAAAGDEAAQMVSARLQTARDAERLHQLQGASLGLPLFFLEQDSAMGGRPFVFDSATGAGPSAKPAGQGAALSPQDGANASTVPVLLVESADVADSAAIAAGVAVPVLPVDRIDLRMAVLGLAPVPTESTNEPTETETAPFGSLREYLADFYSAPSAAGTAAAAGPAIKKIAEDNLSTGLVYVPPRWSPLASPGGVVSLAASPALLAAVPPSTDPSVSRRRAAERQVASAAMRLGVMNGIAASVNSGECGIVVPVPALSTASGPLSSAPGGSSAASRPRASSRSRKYVVPQPQSEGAAAPATAPPAAATAAVQAAHAMAPGSVPGVIVIGAPPPVPSTIKRQIPGLDQLRIASKSGFGASMVGAEEMEDTRRFRLAATTPMTVRAQVHIHAWQRRLLNGEFALAMGDATLSGAPYAGKAPATGLPVSAAAAAASPASSSMFPSFNNLLGGNFLSYTVSNAMKAWGVSIGGSFKSLGTARAREAVLRSESAPWVALARSALLSANASTAISGRGTAQTFRPVKMGKVPRDADCVSDFSASADFSTLSAPEVAQLVNGGWDGSRWKKFFWQTTSFIDATTIALSAAAGSAEQSDVVKAAGQAHASLVSASSASSSLLQSTVPPAAPSPAAPLAQGPADLAAASVDHVKRRVTGPIAATASFFLALIRFSCGLLSMFTEILSVMLLPVWFLVAPLRPTVAHGLATIARAFLAPFAATGLVLSRISSLPIIFGPLMYIWGVTAPVVAAILNAIDLTIIGSFEAFWWVIGSVGLAAYVTVANEKRRALFTSLATALSEQSGAYEPMLDSLRKITSPVGGTLPALASLSGAVPSASDSASITAVSSAILPAASGYVRNRVAMASESTAASMPAAVAAASSAVSASAVAAPELRSPRARSGARRSFGVFGGSEPGAASALRHRPVAAAGVDEVMPAGAAAFASAAALNAAELMPVKTRLLAHLRIRLRLLVGLLTARKALPPFDALAKLSADSAKKPAVKKTGTSLVDRMVLLVLTSLTAFTTGIFALVGGIFRSLVALPFSSLGGVRHARTASTNPFGSAGAALARAFSRTPSQSSAVLLADVPATIATIDMLVSAVTQLPSASGNAIALLSAREYIPAAIAVLSACLASVAMYLQSQRYTTTAFPSESSEGSFELKHQSWFGDASSVTDASFEVPNEGEGEISRGGKSAFAHRYASAALVSAAGAKEGVLLPGHVRPAVASLMAALIGGLRRIKEAHPLLYDTSAASMPSAFLAAAAMCSSAPAAAVELGTL